MASPEGYAGSRLAVQDRISWSRTASSAVSFCGLKTGREKVKAFPIEPRKRAQRGAGCASACSFVRVVPGEEMLPSPRDIECKVSFCAVLKAHLVPPKEGTRQWKSAMLQFKLSLKTGERAVVCNVRSGNESITFHKKRSDLRTCRKKKRLASRQ